MSGPLSLTCVDPARRKYRFYRMFIAPSLFGEWMLVREWGRIGSSGTVRSDRFETAGAALIAMQEVLREKLRRGYALQRSAE